MQYFKPDGPLFVGDCMPFCHEGIFRFFYLLDENHHQGLGGLGGHQWAQASSTDLVHWEHHPLAIGISDPREGSICTGSVFFHADTYYGFYATRMRDGTQHLSLATSRDGVRFEKTAPNPFASPPEGYHPRHYRDPVVFRTEGDGLYHMLVTASLEKWPISDRGGCLARLVSGDLANWEVREPFLVPGFADVPECPDYFEWGGWYYLIFSNGGVARYRMSREPLGPWIRPAVDALDAPASRVMKTAPFGDGRRIGVAWMGTREGDRDDGGFQFGGNAVFRELVQQKDGTLGVRFPEEMVPGGKSLGMPPIAALGSDVTVDGPCVRLAPRTGLAVARVPGIPRNARLMLRVAAESGAGDFGLRLRAGESFDSGYDLCFSPGERRARLNAQAIHGVGGLDEPFDLDIVLKDDIVDVCIGGRRTLIDRCGERRGGDALLYAWDSEVSFEVVKITALS